MSTIKQEIHNDQSDENKGYITKNVEKLVLLVLSPIILRKQQQYHSDSQKDIHDNADNVQRAIVAIADHFEEQDVEIGHTNTSNQVSVTNSSSYRGFGLNELGIHARDEMKAVSASKKHTHPSEVGVSFVITLCKQHDESEGKDGYQVSNIEKTLENIRKLH